MAALLSASPPPAAADDAVAQLIARLARPAPARTPYVEVRFAHLLRRPLLLHGELEYGGADTLGKIVSAPYRETTTIAAGDVTVHRDGHPDRHFALQRAPELGALLSGFSALLGGDAAGLRQNFNVELSGDAATWTLTLTPREADLSKRLRTIVVDGADTQSRCFTLTEAGGDSSVMLIGTLAAAQLPDPPTSSALSALCRAGP